MKQPLLTFRPERLAAAVLIAGALAVTPAVPARGQTGQIRAISLSHTTSSTEVVVETTASLGRFWMERFEDGRFALTMPNHRTIGSIGELVGGRLQSLQIGSAPPLGRAPAGDLVITIEPVATTIYEVLRHDQGVVIRLFDPVSPEARSDGEKAQQARGSEVGPGVAGPGDTNPTDVTARVAGDLDSTHPAAVQISGRAVTNDYVSLRIGPSLEARKIVVLRPEVDLQLFERFGDWFRVRSRSYGGWILSDKVRLLDD